jgi:hypothetical protein
MQNNQSKGQINKQEKVHDAQQHQDYLKPTEDCTIHSQGKLKYLYIGSLLTGQEKELRQFDSWNASNIKDRNLNAEYREGELHGVVGKEIKDALKKEKQQGNNDYSNIQSGRKI